MHRCNYTRHLTVLRRSASPIETPPDVIKMSHLEAAAWSARSSVLGSSALVPRSTTVVWPCAAAQLNSEVRLLSRILPGVNAAEGGKSSSPVLSTPTMGLRVTCVRRRRITIAISGRKKRQRCALWQCGGTSLRLRVSKNCCERAFSRRQW